MNTNNQLPAKWTLVKDFVISLAFDSTDRIYEDLTDKEKEQFSFIKCERRLADGTLECVVSAQFQSDVINYFQSHYDKYIEQLQSEARTQGYIDGVKHQQSLTKKECDKARADERKKYQEILKWIYEGLELSQQKSILTYGVSFDFIDVALPKIKKELEQPVEERNEVNADARNM